MNLNNHDCRQRIKRTTPTQEEKRILIAEACGWKRMRRIGGFGGVFLFRPNAQARHDGSIHWLDNVVGQFEPAPDAESFIATGSEPPDYFNDLNAAFEMEKSLPENDDSRTRYIQELSLQTHVEGHWSHAWDQVRATATQRAEAFGKTLSLW